MAQWVKDTRVTAEAQVPALAQHSGLKDLALLPLAAEARIQFLAQEPPYATGQWLKKKKKKNCTIVKKVKMDISSAEYNRKPG